MTAERLMQLLMFLAIRLGPPTAISGQPSDTYNSALVNKRVPCVSSALRISSLNTITMHRLFTPATGFESRAVHLVESNCIGGLRPKGDYVQCKCTACMQCGFPTIVIFHHEHSCSIWTVRPLSSFRHSWLSELSGFFTLHLTTHGWTLTR